MKSYPSIQHDILPYVFRIKNKSFLWAKIAHVFSPDETCVSRPNDMLDENHVSYRQILANFKAQPFFIGSFEIISKGRRLPSLITIVVNEQAKDGRKYTYPIYLKSKGRFAGATIKIGIDENTRFRIILPPRFHADLLLYPASPLDPPKKTES